MQVIFAEVMGFMVLIASVIAGLILARETITGALGQRIASAVSSLKSVAKRGFDNTSVGTAYNSMKDQRRADRQRRLLTRAASSPFVRGAAATLSGSGGTKSRAESRRNTNARLDATAGQLEEEKVQNERQRLNADYHRSGMAPGKQIDFHKQALEDAIKGGDETRAQAAVDNLAGLGKHGFEAMRQTILSSRRNGDMDNSSGMEDRIRGRIDAKHYDTAMKTDARLAQYAVDGSDESLEEVSVGKLSTMPISSVETQSATALNSVAPKSSEENTQLQGIAQRVLESSDKSRMSSENAQVFENWSRGSSNGGSFESVEVGGSSSSAGAQEKTNSSIPKTSVGSSSILQSSSGVKSVAGNKISGSSSVKSSPSELSTTKKSGSPSGMSGNFGGSQKSQQRSPSGAQNPFSANNSSASKSAPANSAPVKSETTSNTSSYKPENTSQVTSQVSGVSSVPHISGGSHEKVGVPSQAGSLNSNSNKSYNPFSSNSGESSSTVNNSSTNQFNISFGNDENK